MANILGTCIDSYMGNEPERQKPSWLTPMLSSGWGFAASELKLPQHPAMDKLPIVSLYPENHQYPESQFEFNLFYTTRLTLKLINDATINDKNRLKKRKIKPPLFPQGIIMFKLTCVRAEHSTYLTAFNSFASFSPCSEVIGFCLFLANFSTVAASSRKSIWVPTRRNGVFWQWCVISGTH